MNGSALDRPRNDLWQRIRSQSRHNNNATNAVSTKIVVKPAQSTDVLQNDHPQSFLVEPVLGRTDPPNPSQGPKSRRLYSEGPEEASLLSTRVHHGMNGELQSRVELEPEGIRFQGDTIFRVGEKLHFDLQSSRTL